MHNIGPSMTDMSNNTKLLTRLIKQMTAVHCTGMYVYL